MIRMGLMIVGVCLGNAVYAGPADSEPAPTQGGQQDTLSNVTGTAPEVDLEPTSSSQSEESSMESEEIPLDSDASSMMSETTDVYISETENDDSEDNEVGTTSSGKIEKGKGMEFVWAAYGVSWIVLLIYTSTVVRRWWHTVAKGDLA